MVTYSSGTPLDTFDVSPELLTLGITHDSSLALVLYLCRFIIMPEIKYVGALPFIILNMWPSITDIKDKLGWCTLQQRRYVNRLSFFFKSVNNLHGHSLPPHVTRQKRASKNHHAYSYHTLRARTDAYLHSFLPRAIRAWNNLPQDIVLAPSPESFRAQLANKLRSNQITLATSSMTTVPRPGIPIHTF